MTPNMAYIFEKYIFIGTFHVRAQCYLLHEQLLRDACFQLKTNKTDPLVIFTLSSMHFCKDLHTLLNIKIYIGGIR